MESVPHFEATMREAWNKEVQGTGMYKIVKKLKNVKIELKVLNKEGFSYLQAEEIRAYHKMLIAQRLMHEQPGNVMLAEVELATLKEYHVKHQAHIEFLSQKEKLEWV